MAARRLSNLFGLLFVKSSREQYLAQYVIREVERGRPLEEVLADPYVRNRATAEERARLLDRPDVIAAVGETAIADVRLAGQALR